MKRTQRTVFGGSLGDKSLKKIKVDLQTVRMKADLETACSSVQVGVRVEQKELWDIPELCQEDYQ